ncbi:hypothetical protein PCE1_003591 [Barthelona sp. PCE]
MQFDFAKAIPETATEDSYTDSDSYLFCDPTPFSFSIQEDDINRFRRHSISENGPDLFLPEGPIGPRINGLGFCDSPNLQDGYQSDNEVESEVEEDLIDDKDESSPQQFEEAGKQSSFIYGSRIDVEEDKHHEFKAVQNTRKLRATVSKLANHYVCAFLNGDGGKIYFGVEDDGNILGVPLSIKQRDDVRLAIDGEINRFLPQVDPFLYTTEFVPVIRHNPKLQTFVVVITVRKGTAPIYMTNSFGGGSAYIKRDGGIKKATQDFISSRIRFGRSLPYSHLLLDGKTFDCFGRERETHEVLEFLEQSRTRVKLVTITGLPFIGKTFFAHHVCGTLKKEFGTKKLAINMKGAAAEYRSSHDAKKSILRGLQIRNEAKFDPSFMDDDGNIDFLYNSIFDDGTTVLVIENCSREHLIQDMLPNDIKGRAVIIVTSRRRVDPRFPRVDVHNLVLEPLPPAASTRLFRSIAPRVNSSQAVKFTRLLGGLPAAIVSLASLINRKQGIPIDFFLEQLQESTKSKIDLALPSEIRSSLEILPDTIIQALRLVSVFPASFTASFFFDMYHMLPEEWKIRDEEGQMVKPYFLLGDLVETNLLQHHAPTSRYIPHELLRDYGLSTINPRTLSVMKVAFVKVFSDYISGYLKKKKISGIIHADSTNLEYVFKLAKEINHFDLEGLVDLSQMQNIRNSVEKLANGLVMLGKHIVPEEILSIITDFSKVEEEEDGESSDFFEVDL